jgi:hypothetical protein
MDKDDVRASYEVRREHFSRMAAIAADNYRRTNRRDCLNVVRTLAVLTADFCAVVEEDDRETRLDLAVKALDRCEKRLMEGAR